ncbi:MAG: PAS domain S-box protein [Verrucomicrobiae bacterium]|nr:PAS domain S-box protein [Verrucomicrobiae bacterium]
MTKERIIVEAEAETEEGLPEELERLRLLVEETRDWIWEIGPDLRYTYSSAQVQAILGYDASEVIGRAPWDFMPPEEAARVKALLEPRIAARQPILLVENVALHRDGRRVTLETSGKPFFNREGVWLGYIGVDRDISRRRQTEDALRESERRFSTLMDNLQGMVYRCRDDAKWTMEFVSAGALSLTGCSPEALIQNAQRSYDDLIHPEDRATVRAEVRKAIALRAPFQITYRLTTPQGAEKWVWERGRGVFGADGALTAIEGFIMDISERIRSEHDRARADAQMRRLAKLESLGVLAGGVAHEFNNLLTAILGNAEVALTKLPEESPARSNLELICRTALRASELSRQMMAYSGQGGVSLGETDLKELVVESAHHLERLLPEGGRLEYRFEEAVPRLRADSAQIRQALMSLVVNASEAGPPSGGIVTVSVGKGDLRRADFKAMVLDEGQAEGRYAYLEVADKGTGIEATVRSRIFDPFYSTKFAGRGLGLAAVLGVVRAHRGAIRVTSEPGRGSAFRLYFPCASVVS